MFLVESIDVYVYFLRRPLSRVGRGPLTTMENRDGCIVEIAVFVGRGVTDGGELVGTDPGPRRSHLPFFVVGKNVLQVTVLHVILGGNAFCDMFSGTLGAFH